MRRTAEEVVVVYGGGVCHMEEQEDHGGRTWRTTEDELGGDNTEDHDELGGDNTLCLCASAAPSSPTPLKISGTSSPL